MAFLPRYAFSALVTLWVLWLPSARAEPVRLAGGLGAVAARPLSSDVSDVYSLGFGLTADLHLVYHRSLRLSLSVSPGFASGTPVAGALVSNESSTMIQVPAVAALIYTVHTKGWVTPYGGLGLGLLYSSEKVSFDSPLGPKDRSMSATELAWSVVVGVEQNRAFRFFAEGWFIGSGTGGVEGQDGSGTTLNTIHLRLGVRGWLK